MRNVFLICYDVADAKRLRRTYKKMKGFGTPVQYSIFRCELSPVERQKLQEWGGEDWCSSICRFLFHCRPSCCGTVATRVR